MADQKIIIERQKAYKKANPEKIQRIQRKSKLKKLYGITIEVFEQMIVDQDNKCYLCRKLFLGDINVDHDHMTNKIRKLLCTYCNLRMAVIDDQEFLSKATQYRKEHN